MSTFCSHLGASVHPLLSSLLLHLCCMGQHPKEALCLEQPQTAVVLDSLGNLQRETYHNTGNSIATSGGASMGYIILTRGLMSIGLAIDSGSTTS